MMTQRQKLFLIIFQIGVLVCFFALNSRLTSLERTFDGAIAAMAIKHEGE
jgi:hypothetical protein